MSVKVENTENKNEVKLSFVVEAEKFDEAMKKVYAKTAKYFTIPGFRKGKAPMNMVEKQYGTEIFHEDTFNELVPEIYETAIKENNIQVVSNPDIDITQIGKGKDLIFTAIVQTRPEVELGKYKGIELKKIEYPVTDKDIEHELEHMQEHNSRLISIEDRPVEKGDIATIDFEGFVDGVAFEGGKAENHELEIGSHSFIDGFEDQVIGMKIDEEKEINVKAMLDTGNMLKDPITKMPVVVIEKEKLNETLPKELLENIERILGGEKDCYNYELDDEYVNKIKIIPFSSIGKQNGLMIGIKADEITIQGDEFKEYKNVIIGISPQKLSNNYSALFGLDLFEGRENNEFVTNIKK